MELVVGGTLSGKVTTDAGVPVAGARILARSGMSARNAYGRAEAVTDESGAYTIASVCPGAISYASIEHPEFGRLDSNTGALLLPRDVVKANETLEWNIELASGVTVRASSWTRKRSPRSRTPRSRSCGAPRERARCWRFGAM